VGVPRTHWSAARPGPGRYALRGLSGDPEGEGSGGGSGGLLPRGRPPPGGGEDGEGEAAFLPGGDWGRRPRLHPPPLPRGADGTLSPRRQGKGEGDPGGVRKGGEPAPRGPLPHFSWRREGEGSRPWARWPWPSRGS